MPVHGPVPDIVNPDLEPARRPGPANHALGEKTLEHGGKECENVDRQRRGGFNSGLKKKRSGRAAEPLTLSLSGPGAGIPDQPSCVAEAVASVATLSPAPASVATGIALRAFLISERLVSVGMAPWPTQ